MKTIISIALSVLLFGCSSSKWVVENQKEIDRNDFELLNSQQFLERTSSPTPESPVVQYELKASNTIEYSQRVRTDRYIQRYRPSLRSIVFGLMGSGLATYAALEAPTTSTQNVLFGTAGFITLASVLNMKAVGESTPTGESRLLRKTGNIQLTDTVSADPIS